MTNVSVFRQVQYKLAFSLFSKQTPLPVMHRSRAPPTGSKALLNWKFICNADMVQIKYWLDLGCCTYAIARIRVHTSMRCVYIHQSDSDNKTLLKPLFSFKSGICTVLTYGIMLVIPNI